MLRSTGIASQVPGPLPTNSCRSFLPLESLAESPITFPTKIADVVMHPLVDMAKIPVVTLEAYLNGSKPKTVNLNSPKNRKLLAEVA